MTTRPLARRANRRLRSLASIGFAFVALTGCSVAAPPSAIPTAMPPPTMPPPTMPPTATMAPPTATPFPATPTPPAATPAARPSPTAAPTAIATPNLSQPGRIAEYGDSGRREIALTFDAGADRGNAEAILDLLATEGIPASFGIMGEWAEANPDLVVRMVDEGHLLFNHSWSHPSFTGASTQTGPLPRSDRVEQARRTEAAVQQIAGYDLRPYFRPPYGDYDASVVADMAAIGYPVILLWSCDSRDSLGATADEIMANCIDGARPGRIVLLHVGAQSAAYEALPRIIASLRAQGFAFVTVDRILQP